MKFLQYLPKVLEHVICTIDEVQNPLSLKKMSFEGDMTSTTGINDAFQNSKGLWLLIQHCIRGKGVCILANASETRQE